MSLDTGTTQFMLQREGAAAFAQSAEAKRLIEAIPRTISAHERWLVNMTSGRVELASPLMLPLGDTIYKEYEPTQEELHALRKGAAVTVSRNMLSRLSSPEQASVVEQMVLPDALLEQQRKARYERLHGAPAAPVVAPATVTPTPAVAQDPFAGVLPIPDEAAPVVPQQPASAAATAASAFTLAPMPKA